MDFSKGDYPLREIVARSLSKVRGLNSEQKKILWENALELAFGRGRDLRVEMEAVSDRDFKLNLAYDETFY